MALFNKNDNDDRDSLLQQIFHGASYDDAKEGVRAKNLILGILGALAILAVVVFGAIEIISSIVVAMTEKHQSVCEHTKGYDEKTAKVNVEQKAAYAACKDCGMRLKIAATVTVTDTEEATCTANGTRREMWTFAGLPNLVHDQIYTLEKADHILDDVLFPGSQPTCQRDGYTPEGYCTWCGKRVGGQLIPRLECDFVLYGYVEATCFSSGMTGYEECSMCHTVRGENTFVPTLSHQVLYGNFEATYTTGAMRGSKCAVCDLPISITEMTSEPKVSEFFDYEIVNDEYVIIKTVKKSQAEALIPDRINGIPVCYLAEGLFEGDQTLRSVTLSKNLLEIGNRAFGGCTALKEILLPDSVRSVGEECFADCRQLLKVEAENASIGDRAFGGCTRLREVMLGSGVSSIGAYAFDGCKALLCLSIGAPAESIAVDENALAGELSVYDLYYPEGMYADFFEVDSRFARVYQAESKKMAYVKDGECYLDSIDLRIPTLIAIDSEGSVAKVKDGTLLIIARAMERSEWIDTLIVPKSMERIEHSHCDRVIRILFEGNENEWSEIDYYGFDNTETEKENPVFAETYFYSATKPQSAGQFWHYAADGTPVIWE